MKIVIKRFLNDQSGATAIEYGLLVAVIGMGIVVGLSAIRDGIDETFNNVADNLK